MAPRPRRLSTGPCSSSFRELTLSLQRRPSPLGAWPLLLRGEGFGCDRSFSSRTGRRGRSRPRTRRSSGRGARGAAGGGDPGAVYRAGAAPLCGTGRERGGGRKGPGVNIPVYDLEGSALARAWKLNRLPAFVLVAHGKAHVVYGTRI